MKRNIAFMTGLNLIFSMQALIFLIFILGFFPAQSNLSNLVYPEFSDFLRPDHKTFCYRFFVATVLVLQSGSLWFWRRQLNDKDFIKKRRSWAVIEGLLTFFLLSALFKMAVYKDRPQLAHHCFYILLVLTALNKIFWFKVKHLLEALGYFIFRAQNYKALETILYLSGFILIAAVIYVPNMQAAVARMFIGEQFHHNDSFVMGPILAFFSGRIINIDTISQYGFGVPMVIGSLSRLAGSFSYETVLMTMVLMVMAYYGAWFWLLRRWLNSVVLALAGILWALKLQLFHPGVYPFAFTYGSATPLRFWFDVLFFIFIYNHLHKGHFWWQILAGIICGFQIFYIPTEGIYLTATFAAYLFMRLLIPVPNQTGSPNLIKMLHMIRLLLLPLLTTLFLFWCFLGNKVLAPTFWNNLREFSEYFLSGFGLLPIYHSLLDHEFLASLMGFVIPIVYVLTLLIVVSLCYLGRLPIQNLFVATLCIDGLATYHYYVARSALTSYYTVALPYAGVVCFWVSFFLKNRLTLQRQKISLAFLLLSVWALWTNHNFISYPNVFNWSRNPYVDNLVAQPLKNGRTYFYHLFRDYADVLKVPFNDLGNADEGFTKEQDFARDTDLVNYYRRQSDFSHDVQLIQQLTQKDEPVPLVSSFEIKMLMDAERKPYFYYFPLVISRPLTGRAFVRTSIYTVDQLQKTLAKLEEDKPPYIFMERMFLTRPVPDYFYTEYSSFMFLTDYVLSHYTAFENGQYLVALKRKENL